MATNYDLIRHCQKALRENWMYVYGAKGRVLTKEQIKNLQNKWGRNLVYDSDVKTKGGKICCDCSGLISSFTGIERNSQGYFDTATIKKSISEKDGSMVGWGVWKQGHIGVFDGNNGYYAMDSSERNMVYNPLHQNSFTHVIKLRDINYG